MVCYFDDGEENPNNGSIDDPDIPDSGGKIHIKRKRETEQEKPHIEVECVGEYPMVWVIIPTTS